MNRQDYVRKESRKSFSQSLFFLHFLNSIPETDIAIGPDTVLITHLTHHQAQVILLQIMEAEVVEAVLHDKKKPLWAFLNAKRKFSVIL